jgi:glycosyltransferase involved in cell wall biosynthesis
MNEKKKIFINASTVLISGGYYLTIGIIRALLSDNSFELLIICPSYTKYRICSAPNSRLQVVPRWQLKRVFRFYHDLFWLPRKIKIYNPAIVLSLTNIPAKTTFWQIYLNNNPYFLENNLKLVHLSVKEKLLQGIRSFFTIQRFKYIDEIIVQSEYFRENIKRRLTINIPIHIMTPGIPSTNKKQTFENPYCHPENKKKILCLARYFEHKNIEILLQAGKLIKNRNLPFIIYLTLNKKHHRNVSIFLQNIKSSKLEDIIINIGKIEQANVCNYVNFCDAMILPSLLESFSMNYIEAWYYRKPLFVSNTKANRSSCKDAAFFFNPKDEKDIVNSLENLNQGDKVEAILIKGDKRIQEISKWKDYVELLNND